MEKCMEFSQLHSNLRAQDSVFKEVKSTGFFFFFQNSFDDE